MSIVCNVSHRIYAKFEDFRLDGLNSFEIDDLTVSVAVFKMGFGFTFEQLRLRTKYDFDLDLEAINPEKLKGMPSIFGDGTIDFALYNLSFAGNLALQFQDGGSSLKEFKLAFDLDEVRSNITGIFDNEVISQFVNDSLENGIIALTKEVKEFVNEVLEALITPWGNKLLKNVSVNTILGLVTGSIPPPTRPPCLPSSEELSFD